MTRAGPVTASSVYEGVVRHRRHGPHPHQFSYRIAQLYLDLDELDELFAGRWLWSTRRFNLAQFRRADYLAPASVPLAQAVRDRAAQVLGRRPLGPIRLLTNLRYAGYVFNPVSFYFCFDSSEHLDCIVAEITNTPWRERHAYVLPVDRAQASARRLRFDFTKRFHVSPFVPMDCEYRWRFALPGDRLAVHMQVWRQGACTFDATLKLRRRPADARGLRRVLIRYPLMTVRVSAAIYWQALRLWLKRTPFYPHPNAQERPQ